MAGGSFDRNAESAERFSQSLGSVQESASALTSVIGGLQAALLALAGPITMHRELEQTAQAFYKMRLQLTSTVRGAEQYIKTVKNMTSASTLARRELAVLFGEMREGVGFVTNTNAELAQFTARLQREFPQATEQAIRALTEMSGESADFQQLMSKSTSSVNAFALANAKFGSEYARVILAARGDLKSFSDENQTMLTVFAETKAAAADSLQSMSESFKGPIMGVMSLIKGFSELGQTIMGLGDGEVGKALAPILASGAAMLAVKGLRAGLSGKGSGATDQARSVLGNLGTVANPMYVRVIGSSEQLPVGTPTGGKTKPIPGLLGPREPTTLRGRAASAGRRAWRRSGGAGGLMSAGVGGLMLASIPGAAYESVKQEGGGLGVGGAVGATAQGALGGAMVGMVGGAALGVSGGGPVGALIGAIYGLTSAVIAAKQAQLDTVDAIGMSAYERKMARRNEEYLATMMEQEIRSRGGGTVTGERRVRRELLAEEVKTLDEQAENKEREMASLDSMMDEIHTLMLRKEDVEDKKEFTEITDRLKELGVEPGALGWAGGAEERMSELNERHVKLQKDQIKNQERTIVASEELKNLTYKDLQLADSRAQVLQGRIGLLERTLTIEGGSSSIEAIQSMYGRVAGQRRVAVTEQQELIRNRLMQAGGANVADIIGGAGSGQLQQLFSAMGTSDESSFYGVAAAQLGLEESDPRLRELYRTYEQFVDELGPQINELEQRRLELIDAQLSARTFEIDINMQLLEIDQRRMDTMKGIAGALKMAPIVQAQLTAQQIRSTQEQIKLEERRLDEMRDLGLSHVEIYEQTAKIDSLYGRLADQVDYIRRGWEEVFTQQSLNLPGGSYVLPTMTGLMEKGPAFLPYTPNQMGADGSVMGHGTYESIMGFGKASAFSQLQEHLEMAVQGGADSINYFSNELAATGAAMGALRERIEDIAANGYGRAEAGS